MYTEDMHRFEERHEAEEDRFFAAKFDYDRGLLEEPPVLMEVFYEGVKVLVEDDKCEQGSVEHCERHFLLIEAAQGGLDPLSAVNLQTEELLQLLREKGKEVDPL